VFIHLRLRLCAVRVTRREEYLSGPHFLFFSVLSSPFVEGLRSDNHQIFALISECPTSGPRSGPGVGAVQKSATAIYFPLTRKRKQQIPFQNKRKNEHASVSTHTHTSSLYRNLYFLNELLTPKSAVSFK
jgi:hypothetical protein